MMYSKLKLLFKKFDNQSVKKSDALPDVDQSIVDKKSVNQ